MDVDELIEALKVFRAGGAGDCKVQIQENGVCRSLCWLSFVPGRLVLSADVRELRPVVLPVAAGDYETDPAKLARDLRTWEQAAIERERLGIMDADEWDAHCERLAGA